MRNPLTAYKGFAKMYRERANDGAGFAECFSKYIGALRDFLVYGSEKVDYFNFDFFNKSAGEKKDFITLKFLYKKIFTLNDKDSIKYFDNKCLFCEKFADYIGRDWLDIKTCTPEQVENIFKNNKFLFYKPCDLYQGIGVEKINTSEISAKEFFDQYGGKDAILEGALGQNKELAEFNPSSLNTLRVYTFVKDGAVRVFAAVLRMGVGDVCVDNFYYGGLAANIDVQSGVIDSIGRSKKGKEYSVHPESGKKIMGFHIPYWEEIKKTCETAALVVPEVRYVGWDVTVDDNGKVCFIEGNHNGTNGLQAPKGVGWKPLIADWL